MCNRMCSLGLGERQWGGHLTGWNLPSTHVGRSLEWNYRPRQIWIQRMRVEQWAVIGVQTIVGKWWMWESWLQIWKWRGGGDREIKQWSKEFKSAEGKADLPFPIKWLLLVGSGSISYLSSSVVASFWGGSGNMCKKQGQKDGHHSAQTGPNSSREKLSPSA